MGSKTSVVKNGFLLAFFNLGQFSSDLLWAAESKFQSVLIDQLQGWGNRGGGGGARPPRFGQSVNPISTREGGGADYAHQITTRPSDFQTFRHP